MLDAIRVNFVRDICNCNACHARNYKSLRNPDIGKAVDELYEVHIGVHAPVLCKECLAVLGEKIAEALSEDGRPPPIKMI